MSTELDTRAAKEKWKGRTFVLSAALGGTVLTISSVVLFLVLLVDRATSAAERLGVDGGWWLYAAAFACVTALGYGANRTFQKHVFARLAALRGVSADDPDSK